jgi:hypothetical protein
MAYRICRAAQLPELADAMVAEPDLNGEQCHVFWHMATSPEQLLHNLRAAKLLSERSPLSGYASASSSTRNSSSASS